MQDRKEKKIERLQSKIDKLTEENELLKAVIRNYEEQINNESYQNFVLHKEEFERELENIKLLRSKLRTVYEKQKEFARKERKIYEKKTNKAIKEFNESIQ